MGGFGLGKLRGHGGEGLTIPKKYLAAWFEAEVARLCIIKGHEIEAKKVLVLYISRRFSIAFRV